jgi:hypothetical protein
LSWLTVLLVDIVLICTALFFYVVCTVLFDIFLVAKKTVPLVDIVLICAALFFYVVCTVLFDIFLVASICECVT